MRCAASESCLPMYARGRLAVGRADAHGEVDELARRVGVRVAPGTETTGTRPEALECVVHPAVGCVAPVHRERAGDRQRKRRGVRVRTGEVQRHGIVDRHRVQRFARCVREPVDVASQPAGLGGPGTTPSVHPGIHRFEMAQVGMGVTDSLHHGDVPGVPVLLHALERRVEAEVTADRQRLRRGDADRRPEVVVLAEPDRADGVQTVVAAVEFDHDEDAIAPADWWCRERLELRQVGRQRGAADPGRAEPEEPASGQGGAAGLVGQGKLRFHDRSYATAMSGLSIIRVKRLMKP